MTNSNKHSGAQKMGDKGQRLQETQEVKMGRNGCPRKIPEPRPRMEALNSKRWSLRGDPGLSGYPELFHRGNVSLRL